MESTEDKYWSHEIHEKLNKAKDKLSEIGSKLYSDENAPSEYDRLNQILEFAKSSLNISNPNLVPPKPLNHSVTALNNMLTELDNFLNTREISHLQSANSRGDNLIAQLQQIPRIITHSDIENLSASIQNYYRTVENTLNSLNSENDRLSSTLLKTEERTKLVEDNILQQDKSIKKQINRLDAAIAQFQKQFSEAEDRRRENFEKTSIESRKEFDQLRDTINKNWGDFKEKTKSEFDNIRSKSKTDIDSITSKLESQINSLFGETKKRESEIIQSLKDKADAIIKHLNEKRDEASTLVNIIGDTGVTGEFNTNANAEGKQANIYRYVAIFFMSLSVLVVGFIIFYNVKEGIDWQLILFRMGVALILLVPAFYSVRESQTHRQRETHYRKMALELASIDPYLERLPESQRDNLKTALAEKYFGQPDIVIEERESIAKALIETLNMVLKNLTKK